MNENIENKIIENEPQVVADVIPEAEKYEICKRDTVFSVILLVASIVTSAFGIWGGFKSGFTVSSLLLLFSVTAYLLPSKNKIKAFPFLCMFLSIGVSLSFTLTTNGAVRFWSFVIIGLLNLVWFVSLVGEQSEKSDLDIFVNIFKPVIYGAIADIPIAFRSLFSGNQKGGKTLGKALIGIALALPLLLIIIPLLISSDDAFSGMMKLLFDDLFGTVFKIIFGCVIAMFVIAYSMHLKKRDYLKTERTPIGFGIENTIIISFLLVISVCYFAYLFSQLAYFFSAFSGFLPKDYEFTVSEYARQGFFEMTVIAALNFSIIFITLLLSRKTEGKCCLAIRAICTFIGIFTLIIIATALSKMFLYIESFGMTRLRIQTSAFMLFLGIVFISLIIRLYLPKVRVMRVAFITAAAVLIALGTANVNSVVAKYNYEAYKSKTLAEIDVDAIYHLGDEGIPYLVKLADDKNYDVSESAKNHIYHILKYGDYKTEFKRTKKGYTFKMDEEYRPSLGEQTIPRSIAEEELESYIKKNIREIYLWQNNN